MKLTLNMNLNLAKKVNKQICFNEHRLYRKCKRIQIYVNKYIPFLFNISKGKYNIYLYSAISFIRSC